MTNINEQQELISSIKEAMKILWFTRKSNVDWSKRELIITKFLGQYGDPAGYVFCMNGTPPKGTLVVMMKDGFSSFVEEVVYIGKVRPRQLYVSRSPAIPHCLGVEFGPIKNIKLVKTLETYIQKYGVSEE